MYYFQGAKFLSVATDEHWLMRLVDSQTKKPVRTVAKQFVDSFRREFNAAVESARLPRAIEDPWPRRAQVRRRSTLHSNRAGSSVG